MKEGKCGIERKNSMEKDILHITVYTDGACSGNPGAGGWAALILMKNIKNGKKDKVVVKGGEKHTTNNRMELTAVIESLKFIYKNLFKNYMCDIKVNSDSTYVVSSINEGSLLKWQNNGWKTSKNTDVVNKDLWEKIIKLDNKMAISFIKVKGHSDNRFNNYVDEVAVSECNKYKSILNNL
jgi:ribonuclease HI